MSNPVIQSRSRLSVIVFILAFFGGHPWFNYRGCPDLNLRQISQSESEAQGIHLCEKSSQSNKTSCFETLESGTTSKEIYICIPKPIMFQLKSIYRSCDVNFAQIFVLKSVMFSDEYLHTCQVPECLTLISQCVQTRKDIVGNQNLSMW